MTNQNNNLEWYERIFTDGGDVLREMIIETLENQPDQYAADLSNNAFNSDYTFIYTSDAEKALVSYGVFNAIAEIVEYENDNFGQVNTDLSDPSNVANMLTLIKGEELLYTYQDEFENIEGYDWNSQISYEVLNEMINIIKGDLENE